MATVIRSSVGENRTMSTTVYTEDATDITADTFAVAVGGWWEPPTVGWQAPEPVIVDPQHVRLVFDIGDTALLDPPRGYYWRWVRAVDISGDLRYIRVPGRIEVR